MYQMIVTLIAIAMTGAMLLTSVKYVNPVVQIAQDQANRLEDGFKALKKGYDDYVAANGVKPTLLSQVVPAYAFVPPSPQGLSWSFGSGGYANEGRWFCISGIAGPAVYRAILGLTSRFSPQAYFVNADCGTTVHAPPTEDSGGQTPLAATLWVASYAQQIAQGGEPPGQGGGPPGQGGGTPPGQGGTPPGQGGTPPGQGGTPPGQGGTPPGKGGRGNGNSSMIGVSTGQ